VKHWQRSPRHLSSPQPAAPRRWDRDAPPCSEASLQCHEALRDLNSPHHARCQDLLVAGGISGIGSCCSKDQHWGKFCKAAEASTSAGLAREAVCDPASELYGTQRAVLSADNASAVADSEGLWEQEQRGNWQHLLEVRVCVCTGAWLHGCCQQLDGLISSG
jgi:hypothetical protein